MVSIQKWTNTNSSLVDGHYPVVVDCRHIGFVILWVACGVGSSSRTQAAGPAGASASAATGTSASGASATSTSASGAVALNST
jgi:hypothetical protein